MNLLIWIEVPLQTAEIPAAMGILDAAALDACPDGYKLGDRHVGDSELPLHRVVYWELTKEK